jgi:hypothetical protein
MQLGRPLLRYACVIDCFPCRLLALVSCEFLLESWYAKKPPCTNDGTWTLTREYGDCNDLR